MTESHEHPDITDPRVRAAVENPEAVIIDALNRQANGVELTDEDRQQVEFAAKLSVARSLAEGGFDPQEAVDKLNDAHAVSVGIDHGLLFVSVHVGTEDLTKIAPVSEEDQEAFNALCEGLEEAKRQLADASPLPTIEDTDEAWAEAQNDPEVARLLAALDGLPTTDEGGEV